MPWCEPCGRFYSPNTLTPEGYCPSEHFVSDQPEGELSTKREAAATSGAELQGSNASAESADTTVAVPSTAPGTARTKVPWHFWLLLAALTMYLAWRFVQLVGWLIN